MVRLFSKTLYARCFRCPVAFLPDISRGLALFLGGFTLLNVLARLRSPSLDANIWWIDLRPITPRLAQNLLAAAAFCLLLYAFEPAMSIRRKKLTQALIACTLLVCLYNSAVFFLLQQRSLISAAFSLPFSLFIALALALILTGIAKPVPKRRGFIPRSVPLVTALFCLFAFPLAQMLCFGKTSYARNADAIVVFGARVYADGRLSDALADRVRTARTLYNKGYAHTLIFSGGPGDGPIHETEAMKQFAIRSGVPENAIILDKNGLGTFESVANTTPIFARIGATRVLAVSHFYHLPRIKMTYQRNGREVYTVPAKESYTLTKLPIFMLREVAALWVYYLTPLLP